LKPLTTEEIRTKKDEIRAFLQQRGTMIAVIAKEKPSEEKVDKLKKVAQLIEGSIFDQWFESTLTVLDIYGGVPTPPTFTEEQSMNARMTSTAKTIMIAKDTSADYANYVITLVLGLYGGLLPEDQAKILFPSAKEDDPSYIA
jgi:hypothetical protein